MAGVARGETVGCTNPLLFFAHQKDGVLTNLSALSFRVLDVTGAAIERVPLTVLSLADCPAGSRLGPGRYAAAFTAAGSWAFGTHAIEWRYRVLATDPERITVRRFEVLDPVEFSSGASYVGYADSRDLVSATLLVAKAQLYLDEASRRVEVLTGRFFEPRYLTAKNDGRGEDYLAFGHPIIGLDTLEVVDVDVVGGTTLALSSFRVYNRHLAGLQDPDDRDYPKVSFVSSAGIGVPLDFVFPRGPQLVKANGLYGYTEADGTSIGRTPASLARVVLALASRLNADPLFDDPFTSAPGRIRGYKTRDQSISFGVSGASAAGELTGDRAIDDALISMMRPIHIGAA